MIWVVSNNRIKRLYDADMDDLDMDVRMFVEANSGEEAIDIARTKLREFQKEDEDEEVFDDSKLTAERMEDSDLNGSICYVWSM